jgi:hypothetical protein
MRLPVDENGNPILPPGMKDFKGFKDGEKAAPVAGEGKEAPAAEGGEKAPAGEKAVGESKPPAPAAPSASAPSPSPTTPS